MENSKAPGKNLILPEFLKLNSTCWETGLDPLFTVISNSLCSPKTWIKSNIIPVYKKGGTCDPANDQPIKLLEISKLYDRFLYWKSF